MSTTPRIPRAIRDSVVMLEALAAVAELEREHGHATPRDVGELLEVDLGLAAYRMRRLHAAGVIRARKPGRVRGAIVHRYTIAVDGAVLVDDSIDRLEELVTALRPVPAPAEAAA